MRRTSLFATTAALLLLTATACKSPRKPTDANLRQGLNAYFYTHNDCIYPQAPRFPYEVSTTDKTPAGPKGLDALAKAGLLTETEEKALRIKRYDLTPVGTKATPRFCYGHREVTTIDSFTPPENANGRIQTEVSYHYKMMDVPIWAQDTALQSRFPAMAKELSGSADDKATLMQVINGWQVPD